jgi:hypothetical protein
VQKLSDTVVSAVWKVRVAYCLLVEEFSYRRSPARFLPTLRAPVRLCTRATARPPACSSWHPSASRRYVKASDFCVKAQGNRRGRLPLAVLVAETRGRPPFWTPARGAQPSALFKDDSCSRLAPLAVCGKTGLGGLLTFLFSLYRLLRPAFCRVSLCSLLAQYCRLIFVLVAMIRSSKTLARTHHPTARLDQYV